MGYAGGDDYDIASFGFCNLTVWSAELGLDPARIQPQDFMRCTVVMMESEYAVAPGSPPCISMEYFFDCTYQVLR